MSEPDLSFASVSFSYPRTGFRRAATTVLDEFSWTVPAGRTVLLGPNGAGKTTLLSLGASALLPNGGHVTLGDLDTRQRRDLPPFRQGVGWMPQHARAIPGLTCREQVAYVGWLKGLNRGVAWTEAQVALGRVDLAGEADRLASQLSGGQQRRVALAQMLVHNAQVLLLDEPTAGLDPAQRGRFRALIRETPAEVPVVVSTHQVDDLSDVFQTVVVMASGRIRFQGTAAEFLALAGETETRRAEAAYAVVVSD